MLRTIVYVSCASDAVVASFELDPARGTLTALARTPVPATVEPPPTSQPLAVSPDRRFLYAAGRNPPYPLTGFAIGGDGTLTPLARGAHLSHSMAYIATDAGGRFLYGASYADGVLAMNPIGGDGAPGAPAQVLETPPKAHSVLAEPEGRAVYACVLGGDVILRQEIDPVTGRMASPARAVAHSKPGAGPRHFRFARGGRLLYCINELDGTLDTYARDPASGGLEALQSVRLVPPAAPGKVWAGADLHLTPDERFLVGSERFANVLVGFRVNPDGTLDTIGTVAGEPAPRSFAIDPSGRWLACAGQDSGRVAIYAIDAVTGALDRRETYPAGGNASWVEIIEVPG